MKLAVFSLALFGVLLFSGVTPPSTEAQQPDTVRLFIDLPSRVSLTDRAVISGSGGFVRKQFLTSYTISVELPREAVAYLAQFGRFFNIRPEPTATIVSSIDWGVDRINAEQVWGGADGATNVTGNGGAGVKVAVIDTGIYSQHPDLQANVKGGWNFINNTSDYADDNGHGTHVSGTIAAADNGSGLVGVAPQAELYGIKVLNSSGSGSFGDIIEGIEWATGFNGGTKVDVINMSFGCLGSGCNDSALSNALNNAAANGIVLVASAGNDCSNPTPCTPTTDNVGYPAKFQSVIAVAATDSSNNVASFSSRGAAVELAAPGVGINSTLPPCNGPELCNSSTGRGSLNGTSMASPHVAGLAALVKAGNPGITADEIRTLMQLTATDLGSAGRDTSYGFGLVNAPFAVIGELPESTGFLSCSSQQAVISSSGDNNGYTSSPANACSDGNGAAADIDSGTSTSTSCTIANKDRHDFFNYNTNIPGGATIHGIEVRLDGWVDSTGFWWSPSNSFFCVQLSWNGGASWTAEKATSALGTGESTRILGASSDTWGRTWTPSDFSNGNFRVRVTDVSNNSSRDFYLDWTAVRITYSGPSAPPVDTTKPTVTQMAPVNNAVNVPINTTVQATFSEAINPSTLTGSTFNLRNTNTSANVTGNIGYVNNVATFTPSAPLANNTSYTARVTVGVQDLAGNTLLQQYEWSFTTIAIDSTKPTVTLMAPTNGAVNVAINTTVQATFSEAINQSTLTGSTFNLRNTNTSASVTGNIGYANNVATFTPSAPLANNTSYTARVTVGVQDLAGNTLLQQYEWSFTTVAAPVDSTKPTVTLMAPTNGAGSVPINTTVQATFSEAINQLTLTGSTFNLRNTNTSANVTGNIGYANNVATFTPSAPLANNTSYTARVTVGVQDLAGNTLLQQYEWSFTTVAAVTACATPTIISHTDGSTFFGGAVSFSWNAVPGATSYTVQRQNGSSWSTIGTVSTTTFNGQDPWFSDPNWRVYVSAGTCSPLPGPMVTFNP